MKNGFNHDGRYRRALLRTRSSSPPASVPPSNTANQGYSGKDFFCTSTDLNDAPKRSQHHVKGTDAISFVESSQEYQAYMSCRKKVKGPREVRLNTGRSRKRPHRLNFQDTIDTIVEMLVGKCRTSDLTTSVKSCSVPGKEALVAGLDIINPGISDIRHLMETNDRKIAEARLRKRIGDSLPIITTMVCSALRYLWKECNFFATERYGSDLPVTGCGAFFVEKSNGKLRVILDGRYANVFFDSRHSAFSFFTLETLRHVIGNLSTKYDKWYALNFDLRHWFHQIPLPPIYRRYLGMNLCDRNNARGSFWLFPKSLPMGWVFAPYLAQCTTWSLLYATTTKPGKNGQIIHLDMLHHRYDVDQDFLKRTTSIQKNLDDDSPPPHLTPPTWVPLKSGGGIFVFLDNILVLTPKAAVAHAWNDKIIYGCRHFHAVLKGVNETTYDQSTAEQDKLDLKDCFVTLSKGSSASFQFLGVDWSHQSKEVVLKDGDTLDRFDQGLQPDGTWSGSRRSMAGILGKIMWFRRVHGIAYFEESNREQSDAILAVYSKLTPEVNIGAAWDAPFTVPSNLVPGIRSAWMQLLDPVARVTPNTGFITTLRPSDIRFGATDAATGEGERDSRQGITAHLVYSPFDAKGSLLPAEAKALPAFEQMNQFKRNFTGDIALGEMIALVDLVKSECQSSSPPKLIVLATDNMNCKHWVEKGHSHRPDINDHLRDLHDHLRSVDCRLYVTYVPSLENVADSPTRNLPLCRTRLEDTHRRLSHAYYSAIATMWSVAGGQVGGCERM